MVWRIWIVIALLVFGLSACRYQFGGDMDKLVNIGTTPPCTSGCMGKGSPTVVIDSGVGDTMERWQDFPNPGS